MTIPLNRQPTTLANWGAAFYANLWRCAAERARNADSERAAREYGSGHAMWEMHQKRKNPAFLPSLPDNLRLIDPDRIEFDRLAIDRASHIASVLNSDPVTIPDCISTAICDDAPGWRDSVAQWLTVCDDDRQDWIPHTVTIGTVTIGSEGSDLWGGIDLTYYTDGNGDQHWRPFWAVIGGEVYDCRDTTLADCGILTDRIGWYLCQLDAEPLPDDVRADRFSEGYSLAPTSELESALVGDSRPVWHWGLNCFVGRIQGWDHPVRMHPEPPCYGG